MEELIHDVVHLSVRCGGEIARLDIVGIVWNFAVLSFPFLEFLNPRDGFGGFRLGPELAAVQGGKVVVFRLSVSLFWRLRSRWVERHVDLDVRGFGIRGLMINVGL